jgi:hypothetical protein
MHQRTNTPKLVSALAAAAAASCIAAGTAQASGYFDPHAIYNCTAVQAATGGIEYIDSYQFKSHHRYSVGYQNNGHLTGTIHSGKYRRAGSKIIPSSGPLKKAHESFLIQQSDLALLDSHGHFTGIGCRNPKYKPPSPTPPAGQTMPLGTYTCYETTQELGGGYFTGPPSQLTFYDDGTYYRQGSIRGTGWSQSGTTISFTGGPFWSDASHAHDQGTWYPSGGVTMPHAQGAAAGLTFSLVIKDTRAEGGIPPSQEFVTTDDPSDPSGSVPMSFLYCKQ